ncbi:MAG: type II toxin-antitoxin system RelE/ParE family toxin [Burkholderiaceae bacterium]|nr:type II toxin-antitoxin system RelE/ParE family toxin [Burkholderiaceae bacterium]
MARVILQEEVLDDFDRFLDHLMEHGVEDPAERIGEITDALRVLETSPFIGRPTGDGLRELVIGTGARGYVALYEYDPEHDAVFVLAVRSQKEAGYKRL